MISGKLGEDKQNKQEKSETAIRESIGVVPLALPLMAGPGRLAPLSSGGRVITVSRICLVFQLPLRFLRFAAGRVPYGAVAGSFAGQTGINVITRIMGLLLMALGIEFIVTGIKGIFPGLLN